MKEIGKIDHFFDKAGVAVVALTSDLRVGDVIHIRGATTDFSQKIDSMQIEHKNIEKAKAGDLIAIKVFEKVRPNDLVFLEE